MIVCARCFAECGFGRETDGRTRIQPVYNASSTGVCACLPRAPALPLSRCARLSLALSGWPFRSLSLSLASSPFPAGAAARDYTTSTAGTPAVPYALPPPSSRPEKRRRRRRASCIHLNQYARPTSGAGGECKRRRRAKGRMEDPAARRHRSLHMYAARCTCGRRTEVMRARGAERDGPEDPKGRGAGRRGWKRSTGRFSTVLWFCVRTRQIRAFLSVFLLPFVRESTA